MIAHYDNTLTQYYPQVKIAISSTLGTRFTLHVSSYTLCRRFSRHPDFTSGHDSRYVPHSLSRSQHWRANRRQNCFHGIRRGYYWRHDPLSWARGIRRVFNRQCFSPDIRFDAGSRHQRHAHCAPRRTRGRCGI